MASINQPTKTGSNESEIKEILPVSNHPETGSSLSNNNEGLAQSRESEREETLQCSLMGCVKFFHSQWRQRLGSDVEQTRIYHVWPGKNVFFFGGRFICGPDPRGFILTTVAVLVSSWIFCVYIGDNLTKHPGLIVAISVVLTVTVFLSLIMVSAIDPGIIPRNDRIAIDETGASNGVKSKKVTINGVEVKLKFCRICKILRPPRSCHCTICDNCVEKFDHHCPWIGQCIGLRNYRFYLLFLTSALIFFIYLFTFSCGRINQKMMETGMGLFRTLLNCPETLVLAPFSSVAMLFLGGLASYHSYLIMLNETAYENYRQFYANSPNPYNKGILRNIREALFTKFPPSRVAFRAETTSSRARD